MNVIAHAVASGMLVMLAGLMPWNVAFASNLRYYNSVPWASVVIAAYLWFYWRYLRGDGASAPASAERRQRLRAFPLSRRVWLWSLSAGAIAIVLLVVALRLANRVVALPIQQAPDWAQVPQLTILSLLITAAPVAGLVEESAFRGYMQGPIERRYGILPAILITGTMFAVAHLDFTPILWPYYLAVAAIYGRITYLTKSILPAIVLHTAGNLYSNIDLWRHGQAEWQAASAPAALIWNSGVDASFLWLAAAVAALALTTAAAYVGLAQACRRNAEMATR